MADQTLSKNNPGGYGSKVLGIWLTEYLPNVAAVRLWESVGFTVFESPPNYADPDAKSRG